MLSIKKAFSLAHKNNNNNTITITITNTIKSFSSLSPLQLTGEEIINKCKEHSLYSWSAQKAVNPIYMEKAKGICK